MNSHSLTFIISCSASTYSLTWVSNTIGVKSLTSVFGMGTGVSFSLLTPSLLFPLFISASLTQDLKKKIYKGI